MGLNSVLRLKRNLVLLPIKYLPSMAVNADDGNDGMIAEGKNGATDHQVR